MNYCSKCSKVIHSIKNCDKCKRFFCSEICLRYHIYTNHLNEQYTKQSNNKKKKIINDNNYNNNNYLEISYTFSSPYLTKGTMTLGKIIYDQTYSLKNFKPYIENGKEKIIGSGSYGKVFLAINQIDKKYYAIKHMKKKDLYKALKTLKGIYTEIDIQSRINHPNIVKILYVKENKETFDFVMEYAKNGNLFHYIKKHTYLSEEKSFKFFIQVVNAIFFLHQNDIIHRDIKPENILMFEDGVVKLCDFGWCARLEGGQRITFCGTVEYMSPEMVNKEEYNKEIDVWSLGVLLYEMIHGYSPFKPNKPKFKISDVISNIKIQNLKFNKEISEECKELIIHLLDRDITKRYKIDDIYNSKFVKFFENKEFNLINEHREINLDIDKDFFKENNNITLINPIKSNQNIITEKELQIIKNQTKNNTARNFYPNPLEKNKEKDNIEANNNHKYGSHCKIKTTLNKFDKNFGITPRYISQENLNNFFKKPNVKEKVQKNAFSEVDLLAELKNNEKKIQSITRNLNSNENIKKNIANQPLTCRNKKMFNQTAKNRQISIDQKKNATLVNAIIQETKDINYKNNNKNFTNRDKSKNAKVRIKSCETHQQKKVEIKAKVYFNSNNIEEDKSPLFTEIYDSNNNNNNITNITNMKRKLNSKVKTKILRTEEDNPYEIKLVNMINNQTGKRNTKVKNYYRNNNKKSSRLLDNNNINLNNNNCDSSPQINIINNNLIYNKNIIKYSFFSHNNNEKNKDDFNKDLINENFEEYKPSQNKGIILLTNKDNKRKKNCPIKLQINKDNNSSYSKKTIQDLDETPKKDIDNLKIMPTELLTNFEKELKGYLKKNEIS